MTLEVIKRVARQDQPEEKALTEDKSIVPEKVCSEIESWSDQRLYDEVRQFIYDHTDFPDSRIYDVGACIELLSRRIHQFTTCPYMLFLAPAESGKSRAVRTLTELCSPEKRVKTASVTPAGLFRLIEAKKPEILGLDEGESFTGKGKEDIIALLNSGYEAGTPAIRVEKTRKGAYVIQEFNVYGIKIIASTKSLPETVTSRCIVVNMARRNRKVNFDIDMIKAREIVTQLNLYGERYANRKIMKEFVPEEWGSDRLAQLFRPLFQVAPTPEVEIALQSLVMETAKQRSVDEQESFPAYAFKAAYQIFTETQTTLDGKSRLETSVARLTGEIKLLMEKDGYGERDLEYWTNWQVGSRLSDLGFYKERAGKDRTRGWGIKYETFQRELTRYCPDLGGRTTTKTAADAP